VLAASRRIVVEGKENRLDIRPLMVGSIIHQSIFGDSFQPDLSGSN
jgi:hypothetical protein